MLRTLKKIGAWIERNEHHLGAVVFLGGFVLDVAAFRRADLPLVNGLFVAYIVVAVLGIALAHFLLARRPDLAKKGRRSFPALCTLAAQFSLGGLLSGCLILYFRSAVLAASWPFIAALALVFAGNELLHTYRERLAFQVGLFYLTLYAYAIFELPIVAGSMGPHIFLLSGVASLAASVALCAFLYAIARARFMQSARTIAIGFAAIFILVNASYFTGVLPPLPLALTDAEIAHGVARTAQGYDLSVEAASSGLLGAFRPLQAHVLPGEPLYAYSAVFAPITITTPIVHRWEYDDPQKGWQTVTKISFPIAGGRDGGYRGYSESYAVTPGRWRVSIETSTGQVIGRVNFTVVSATAAPILETETK
jgi:hypothetical protein